MLKKTIKKIALIVIVLITIPCIYILISVIFSGITVNAEVNTKKELSIYILTNGAHTDLVLPAKNEQIDWTKEIKYEYTKNNDSSMQYLAIGWGDKGFYLETPTWADLKFRVAFKAAFALSSSAIHATYYKTIKESENCVKIAISKKQYNRLIKYIKGSFKCDIYGHFINIKTNAIYGNNDAFYEAKGKYSIFHTCNTWANNGLIISGQKACLWTPVDKAIFNKYKN